ncbi:hypothetical protein BpHYR1_050330 [Brachionus plicatilis]|uniref:Uncharacterized protein n=1 Tax=Brachionus plicatilis TaxID=10195 RepID=A0A3M7SDC9_BRAPC|nr:hypothetical protein BpHYR1_050330 [Brachionus plicatilis]
MEIIIPIVRYSKILSQNQIVTKSNNTKSRIDCISVRNTRFRTSTCLHLPIKTKESIVILVVDHQKLHKAYMTLNFKFYLFCYAD